MAELQGLCHWPGVNQVVSASLSFTHGISPSVATLYMPPQEAEIASSGILDFTFGDVHLGFPDCRVDEATLTVAGGGWQWLVSILDRRWKWRFGSISGNYNLYTSDGLIREGTEKSPYDLAKLCLEAAGEENYDIGSLPGDPRPQIQWGNEVPMEALANLCDQFGCRVVLGPVDNKVYIHPVGTGKELPDGYVMEEIGAIDPGEAPDEIVIVCGPTRYQNDLKLYAVGIQQGTSADEIAGPGNPVNYEFIWDIDNLDYKPNSGWGFPPDLLKMTAADENNEDFLRDQRFARASVFRYYEVSSTSLWAYLEITGHPRFDNTRWDSQIELESEQVKATYQADPASRGTTFPDLILANMPAEVRGQWYDAQMAGTNIPADTPLGHDLPDFGTIGFSLDLQRRLVITSDYVYLNDDGEFFKAIEPKAADLILRTAFKVRTRNTFEYLRHEFSLPTGSNNNTKPRYIHHDEIVLKYLDGEPMNLDAVNAACTKLANAAIAEYEGGRPYTRKYAGLRDIQLDGAIQNVTWSVGPSGATTTASRNTEQLERVQPYRARRRQEHVRQLEREKQEEKKEQ